MWLKQIFIYSNNYFKNLSKIERILLYFLPLILSVFILYVFKPIKIDNKRMLTDIKKLEDKIDDLKIISQIDMQIVLKEIEDLIAKNNLILSSMKVDERTLYIHVKGNIANIISLINYCEHYSNSSSIHSLLMDFNEIENSNHLKIKISFDKNYIKDNTYLQQFYKELDNFSSSNNSKKKVKTNKEQTIDFKLSAIVGEYALLNNKWYKKEDIILNHIIQSLSKNSVVLQSSNNKKIHLKLFQNE